MLVLLVASMLANTSACDVFVSAFPPDFLDLQSAVDAVAPGSTICYRPAKSPYPCEDAIVNKTVSISAANGSLGNVVIDCQGGSRFLRAVSTGVHDSPMSVSLDSLVLQGGMAVAGGLIYAEHISLRVSNSRLANSASTCNVLQDQRDGQILTSAECYQTYPLRRETSRRQSQLQTHSLPNALPQVGGGGGIYAVNCAIEIDHTEFNGLQAGSFGGQCCR